MAKRTQQPLEEYRRKRDFEKTPEPAGKPRRRKSGGLRFVIQKHAASHLHYDLRLEMEGVMRSWAVPKGPSLDPKVRRLAMEVEDHPIEYNDFEGTIPAGEYGGGTVMLWDRGTYTPDEARKGEAEEAAVLRGYEQGKLSIRFHGERLNGSFALVRTDTVEGGVRSKWLLMKHRDEAARAGKEVTEAETTSVVSGRSMEEIAAGKGGRRVWHSNRSYPELDGQSATPARKRRRSGGQSRERAEPSDDLGRAFSPMLATLAAAAPRGADWIYEPKYDGIRVLAFATAHTVALITRNGHDKAKQFPEVVEALRALCGELDRPLVLDGEVVPLEEGRIERFERLQARMHVTDGERIEQLRETSPAALVVFDLLVDGATVHVHSAWSERRSALEDLLGDRETGTIRLSEQTGDPGALLERAHREGWEGIVAKRRTSRYRPGQRSSDWLKVKLENRQELVVGGWTEPRNSRSYLGSILLGYYDEDGGFVYAGHTGTGFSQQSLQEVYRRLKPLERKTPPFEERPKTNEKAHWVTPRVVVEVKFNEWTRDGKLRQPVFLGVRDDKDPREVVRERAAETAPGDAETGGEDRRTPRASKTRPAASSAGSGGRSSKGARSSRRPGSSERPEPQTATARAIRELEGARGEGELRLGRSDRISITSLKKVFYPQTGHTKADLLAYYAEMAAYILPRMKDRPLVLKRFPNGVDGEAFYQQAAPDSVPPGVRVETLISEGKEQRRLVGGNLPTLLYTIQLGAISYDPWHSRIDRLESADYTILDLDPGPGASFDRVVEVARRVREEMDELGLTGALKTSGSRGLHVYLPLPDRTPLDAATLVAQIVATRVAQKHPEIATIERMTKNRPDGTVYVDYLQNILGKTVAGVYAARARPEPTVSTPLAWEELGKGLDPREFTIDSVPPRVGEVGDLWTRETTATNDLRKLLPKARERASG